MNPFQERAKRPGSAIAGPYGHPFHAMLVPLPIGCFVATLALDIASRGSGDGTGYTRASTVVLGLGVAGALLAAIFGFMDFGQLTKGTKAYKVASAHLIGNLVVVGMFAASFLARFGTDDVEVPGGLLAIDLVALCLLTVTGWLGGKLAYHYGVRVADERTQAEGYEDISGLLPPELSSAGRVDRIPGTNIPEDQAR